jgi:hypothetical protein
MEKGSPSSPSHAQVYRASNPPNPSDNEYPPPCDATSTIDHAYGIENAPDNEEPSSESEAPPAYHQLAIEGGNISAEVMRK